MHKGDDVIYFGETESVVVLSVLVLGGICTALLRQVPEIEVFDVFLGSARRIARDVG
jgi:hypothetical protein